MFRVDPKFVEVGCDDHVSSILRGLPLFVQTPNSSDTNMGDGAHIPACLTVGDSVRTRYSTIMHSYKDLLML